jgi:hypothetical protein
MKTLKLIAAGIAIVVVAYIIAHVVVFGLTLERVG